jgi:hypothetical protein
MLKSKQTYNNSLLQKMAVKFKKQPQDKIEKFAMVDYEDLTSKIISSEESHL